MSDHQPPPPESIPISIAMVLDHLERRLLDKVEARRALVNWAAAGRLTCTAASATGFFEGRYLEEISWRIPQTFWQRLFIEEQTDGQWLLGNLTADLSSDPQYDSRRHQSIAPPCVSGIGIDEKEFHRLLLDLPQAGAASAPLGNLQPDLSRGGRPPANWWPDFAVELAVYIHDTGPPDGQGQHGQDAVIRQVFTRLVEAGKAEPGRTSAQKVIKAVLERIRLADK